MKMIFYLANMQYNEVRKKKKEFELKWMDHMLLNMQYYFKKYNF